MLHFILESAQVGIIPRNPRYPRYVVSQSQMLLSVDSKKVSPRLVYCFFRSLAGQQALLANTNTTGVPSIARPSTSLKAIHFVLPTKQISDKFEQITRSLSYKSEINTQESRSLISLRNALLIKLLSGEIRMQDAEQALEAVA